MAVVHLALITLVAATEKSEDSGFFSKLFDFLTRAPHTFSGTVLRFCVLVILLLLVLTGFLNAFAKALEAWDKNGINFRALLNKLTKALIRRRQQFCRMLASDLATLAKAESWNDQNFIDLEAEVEIEGGYYPTIFRKIVRRPAFGLRRLPSLMEALESSSERSMLIVGEPGSGKSVALRHLATQMAEIGMRSGRPTAPIPLYLNLKEISSPRSGSLDAEFVKQFVFDNIRRGDSDTVAYLSENWANYRAEGTWVFLFDSFDEIPEVLHAPTGSPIIREYAEAIRQFLDSSGCRGLVASREFKGPDALPWKKLRILPLTEERQAALVENTFLSPEQKDLIRRHIAYGGSGLNNNPMFLNLLCRYVKELNQVPLNDYQLLSGHIQRLAHRDADYLQRRYGYSAEQLLQGAEHVAVLLATTPQLGLAPTSDEMANAARGEWDQETLAKLLAALVDVKIGRSDVREAKQGDQRFTFSHRRYQEALFVLYLAKRSDVVSTRDLLTDDRWREYAVTFLQSQPMATVQPMLTAASGLLDEYADGQAYVQEGIGGLTLTYYEWNNHRAISLLGLLQEGLVNRLRDLPECLPTAVAHFLGPRWMNGDLYDRGMVIRLGGLLPDSVLQEHLAYGISLGAKALQNVAFRQAIFLAEIPAKLAWWLRYHLSRSILREAGQTELLRLQALAARLPAAVGASFVVRRCTVMSKLLYPFIKIGEPLMQAGRRLFWRKSQVETAPLFAALVGLYALCTLAFVALAVVSGGFGRDFWPVGRAFLHTGRQLRAGHQEIFSQAKDFGGNALGRALILLLAVFWLSSALIAMYGSIFQAAGYRVTIGKAFREMLGIMRTREMAFAMLVLAGCAGGVGGGLWISRYAWAWMVYSALGFAVLSAVGSFLLVLGVRRARWRRRLRDMLAAGLSGAALALRAASIEELSYWFTCGAAPFTVETSQIRFLSRLLLINAEGPYDGAVMQNGGQRAAKEVPEHLWGLVEESLYGALEPEVGQKR